MIQNLAEYRHQLNQSKELISEACIKSLLFERSVEQMTYTDDWKPDFNTIFTLLHKNFNNPKAMNCFIFYDIEDNRLRVKLAKYLLEKGAQRIQKSVYLANISKKLYNEIYRTMIELEAVLGINDSIFMVPIGEYHLAEMKMVGRDVDMSFSRSSQHVIFI